MQWIQMNKSMLEELIQEALDRYLDPKKIGVQPDYPVSNPLGSYCDHSVLRCYTKQEIVEEFCREAIVYGAANVSVNPCHIVLVHRLLEGTPVRTGAAIGFPLGVSTPAVKRFEAVEAVNNGADEVDMVINVGRLRDGDYLYVYEELRGLIDAVKDENENTVIKMIAENCYLSRQEKIAACIIALQGQADFIKTSTGMGTGGATIDDVRLMKAVVGDRIGVKAAGNVRTQEDVLSFIRAGATRVGVSRVMQIVTGNEQVASASSRNQPPKC